MIGDEVLLIVGGVNATASNGDTPRGIFCSGEIGLEAGKILVAGLMQLLQP